jgi:hypothetical protein
MATIHDTTMTPTKLELLAAWLPLRTWYRSAERHRPRLRKAGGFRLDDPAGEVGIEFLFAADDGQDRVYQLPLTYRGTPLAGAADALVGTAEHGVLGTRWVYDGTRDPVLVAQLLCLCQGEAVPQHQSRSDTADPSVQVSPPRRWGLTLDRFTTSDSDAETRVTALARRHNRPDLARVVFRVPRVLAPAEGDPAASGVAVLANWAAAGGNAARGTVARAYLDEPPASSR